MSSPSSASRMCKECFEPNKRARIVSPPQSPQSQQRKDTAPFPNDIHDTIAIIETMKRQESGVYKPCHYLEGTAVTEHDRKEMCKWGFSIADACHLDRKLAVVAITYFDRFLSCRGIRSVDVCLDRQRECQLAFIACLIVAFKGREGIDASPDFVAHTMCNGVYHPEEVSQMEVEVLRTLAFRLNGPTPQDFIQYFMELLPPSLDERIAKKLADEAIMNSETAMLDYSLALEPLSCIALVSIGASFRVLGAEVLGQFDVARWIRYIGSIVGGTSEDL